MSIRRSWEFSITQAVSHRPVTEAYDFINGRSFMIISIWLGPSFHLPLLLPVTLAPIDTTMAEY